jgi:hypothetical protein
MIIQHLKTSPVMIISLTALSVAVAFSVAGYFGLGIKAVDPHVTMESNWEAPGKQTTARQNSISTLIDGEVARTADRIGEATALAFSVCLHVANEQIERRTPRTVRDLLAGVAARNCLPPGLTLTQTQGVLASAHGMLWVRYRPTPLGIEVVSVSSFADDGPALIVRLPNEASAQGEAALFIANSLAGVKVPDPFAPTAEVIASGWSQEPWRSLK